jgi:hypothetical protein
MGRLGTAKIYRGSSVTTGIYGLTDLMNFFDCFSWQQHETVNPQYKEHYRKRKQNLTNLCYVKVFKK